MSGLRLWLNANRRETAIVASLLFATAVCGVLLFVRAWYTRSADVSNIYWNGKQTAPVLLYLSGQVNLNCIGWFDPSFRIGSRVSAPRINADRCHSALGTGGKVQGGGTRAGVLQLIDPLPGNTELKLTYVRIMRSTH